MRPILVMLACVALSAIPVAWALSVVAARLPTTP
jgi:hypothetical protein